ncbi:MAG: oligopeptidase A [Gammaproteobacteria bacterium]|nr:oligopeptidase A [Gammaproteobacteria bacterium]MCI0591244.1 oligopeptidase A [Gammaproteobacteria bacterium]
MQKPKNNPLLDFTGLPAFASIKPDHIQPAIDYLLDDNRHRIAAQLETTAHCTWDNTVQVLEDLDDRLNRSWSPASHLHAVADSEALRKAYNACLPKLSDYATELGQNKALYDAYKYVAEGNEYPQLGAAKQKIIDNALRDFRLSGIELNEKNKVRFKNNEQQLSCLQTKFEENLLDATHAWEKHITDKAKLAGLPESALALARQTAKRQNKSGWVFTLELPSYMPVMNYADDPNLRLEMYEAYVTRASGMGPTAGQWDNSEIMEKILALRHEQARLLGFANYAELSLAKKMAKSPQQVLNFLEYLANRSKPVAEMELTELQGFAKEHHRVSQLTASDIGYYSEKLRQHRFAFSQEDLRPYFPVPGVLEGLFAVVNRLYGLAIREQQNVNTWHPDVRFFKIYDEANDLRGSFYLDLYARAHKRGGAWMDQCIVRKKTATGIQSPVAYLTCNFTPPVGNDPALLEHDEVITLFHEFGHGLHHMLTRIDYPGVAGINGIPWDAVELPSQLMENWCWKREALDLIASHYKSGAPIGQDLYEKLLAAKNFQSGMQMVRQLEFALFDFRLHLEYDPAKGARIQQILDDVRKQVAVVIPPSLNRFQHSFAHIFSGGYAAGYYSYKWAEILSADAFSKFEENGIFNRETGRHFMRSILEQGGARDPLAMFIDFRGREPSIEPLLQQSGISAYR